MSKRCPKCLHTNEDARIFCTYCGTALDAELRLIQELERQSSLRREEKPEKQNDLKFYVPRSPPPQKKSSAGGWIFFLLLAAAAAWFFLKG
ncbi:MAG: hypothetical protein HFF38_01690 [Lawsonibacter sp.]|jgi:uncharacterized membrane protein YvbJ|nr:hypothetical protein [Lawsonibacter sp.]